MLRLDAERRARLVDVSWSGEGGDTYAVRVSVRAWDRRGLLRDVTTVLSAENVDIAALDTEADPRDQSVAIHTTLRVRDLEHLSRVLDRIGQLPNVFEARRTG
jgi:GTP pyrophosphokinase